jgi:hypothetical protein
MSSREDFPWTTEAKNLKAGTSPTYSMKEWKPEQVYNKMQRIEHELQNINDLKVPLVNEKRVIEADLVEMNVVLKNTVFSDPEYNKINSRRGQLVKKKTEIELKISELKQRSVKLHTEKESAKIDLKNKPNELIKTSLQELRDKYLAFAADTTRVSSMRAMASRFVEEIQSVIGYVV